MRHGYKCRIPRFSFLCSLPPFYCTGEQVCHLSHFSLLHCILLFFYRCYITHFDIKTNPNNKPSSPTSLSNLPLFVSQQFFSFLPILSTLSFPHPLTKIKQAQNQFCFPSILFLCFSILYPICLPSLEILFLLCLSQQKFPSSLRISLPSFSRNFSFHLFIKEKLFPPPITCISLELDNSFSLSKSVFPFLRTLTKFLSI